MARKQPYRAVADIDPRALASFQASIRKRYSNEQILTELRASADRADIEGRIRERMKYYATPFSVEWATEGEAAPLARKIGT